MKKGQNRFNAVVDVVFDESDTRKFIVQKKQRSKLLRQVGYGTLSELRHRAHEFQGSDIAVIVRENGVWKGCRSNPFLGVSSVNSEQMEAAA